MLGAHYIEFPALGWNFTINPVLAEFSLFGATITIRWYGVLIAVGFLLAVLYALKRSPELELNPDHVIDATLVCTLCGFIGARLYYVLFCADLSEYLAHPLTIFAVWKGGIGIYGGIIGAFLSGIPVCKWRKLSYLGMCDIASLGFLIGQAIGRWGNFFNQEAFGANTALPWGMTGDIIASGANGTDYITSLPVHPTFFYESLWCILGFVLLHIVSKKWYKFHGEIFCGYLVWYGLGRFCIESLRTDSLMIGAIRTSQLVAVLAILGGILLFFFLRYRQNALPKTLPATDTEPSLAPEGEAPIVIVNTEEKPSENTEIQTETESESNGNTD